MTLHEPIIPCESTHAPRYQHTLYNQLAEQFWIYAKAAMTNRLNVLYIYITLTHIACTEDPESSTTARSSWPINMARPPRKLNVSHMTALLQSYLRFEGWSLIFCSRESKDWTMKSNWNGKRKIIIVSWTVWRTVRWIGYAIHWLRLAPFRMLHMLVHHVRITKRIALLSLL